jgi:hypothetical protein
MQYKLQSIPLLALSYRYADSNSVSLEKFGTWSVFGVQVLFVVVGHPGLQTNPASGPFPHGTGAWYLGPGNLLNSSRL